MMRSRGFLLAASGSMRALTAALRGLVLLLVMAAPAVGQWQSIGDVQSVMRESNRVTLNCRNAKVQVTALAPDLIRVRMKPGALPDRDESWAVVKTSWPSIPLEFADERNALRLTTPELIVEMSKSPCRITIRNKNGQVINQDDPETGMGWDGSSVRVAKVLPVDEYYYGLAENAMSLELRGQAMVKWNTDAYGYRWGTDPLYQSIPFLLAMRGGESYGIFLDNTYRSVFDLGKLSRTRYSFGAEDGELNYYFFYGPHPKKVIERYTELVGRMPLPPRWALGYQQCRWSYEPEERVREIVTQFRYRSIPCDVIYLDIDYMDGYRCFTIDQAKFPNFRQMITDFAVIGMKVVTILDPGIKVDPGYKVYQDGLKGDHFIKMPNGTVFTGPVWPGTCVFPDFTRETTRHWWGELYRQLVEDGVRGFWNDMNEPALFIDTDRQWDRTMSLDAIHNDNGQMTNHRKSHNVYGMLMARATYEAVRTLRSSERPFVLTRSSYAGGHRYAATWTGDNTSNWEHLYLWIPMTLSFGLSGQPFAGPDIGGFSESPSPELFTRFLQAGVMSPLSRTHTAKGTKNQEPWAFGPEYEAINRQYIELRYRLMPYIYTAFEEAARTGIPVMRPLFLEFPKDPRTYRLDTQYLFGPDLMVAPVLLERATTRQVYVPEGEWYDLWSGEKVAGPKEVTVTAPIDTLPVLVRGGGIVPMQQVMQYVDEVPVDPLTLSIFPSGDSSRTLYEDDGLSFEYEKGGYARTRFRCRQMDGQIVFDVGEREGNHRVAPRSYMLRFNGRKTPPRRVKRGEEMLPRVSTFAGLRQSTRGWTYDQVKRLAWVKFPDDGRSARVVVQD